MLTMWPKHLRSTVGRQLAQLRCTTIWENRGRSGLGSISSKTLVVPCGIVMWMLSCLRGSST
jgi:hypothetical protein